MTIAKKAIPLIIIILSFWAVKPFFSSGFFPIHDDTQVARVFEMKQSLGDGMFPVRWVSDLGYNYGYPIFNFYAPLAYYIGGVFNLVGADSLVATKLMMVVGILLSGLFMYFLAKEFWGDYGGIVAALLYIYAPYHALDIYVRGDVAEFYAYAFIPLVFLSIYKIFKLINNLHHESEQDIKLKFFSLKLHLKVRSSIWMWVSVCALAYAAVVLSHNLTAMMVTPFVLAAGIIFYILLYFRKKAALAYFILLGLLLGVLLSAFYWMPTLSEMHYTNVISQIGGGSNYKDHFVCLPQLWESQWGFAGSAPGCVDGFSFRIGKLHILLSLFSLVALWFLWKINRAKFAFVLFGILSSIFSVFLTLDYSKFIWSVISPMDFFQFPWRFLIMISFFISFLSGSVLWILERKMIHHYISRSIYFAILCILVVIIIWFNTKLFIPQKNFKIAAKDYVNFYNLTWTTSAISDEYMPQFFRKPTNSTLVPKQKISVINNSVKLSDYSAKTQRIDSEVSTSMQTVVRFAIAYFPAWHIFIDGNQSEFTVLRSGLQVAVPAGKHKISAIFIQTPIEKLANAISVVGVLVIFIGIISTGKEKSHDKKA